MPLGEGAKGSAVSAAVGGGGDDDILFPLFIARAGRDRDVMERDSPHTFPNMHHLLI